MVLEKRKKGIFKRLIKRMFDNFDIQVKRNIQGQMLEKKGMLSEAIRLYETNVTEKFKGSFPYRKLAIIYSKQKQYSEEIRILEIAVDLYSKLLKTSPRSDVRPKLERFIKRLQKAKLKARKVQ